MKEFLSQAGVAYVLRDVDDDLSAYRELTSRGFRTVPVTFVGEQAVIGFDREALRLALGLEA